MHCSLKVAIPGFTAPAIIWESVNVFTCFFSRHKSSIFGLFDDLEHICRMFRFALRQLSPSLKSVNLSVPDL